MHFLQVFDLRKVTEPSGYLLAVPVTEFVLFLNFIFGAYVFKLSSSWLSPASNPTEFDQGHLCYLGQVILSQPSLNFSIRVREKTDPFGKELSAVVSI